MSNYNAAMSLQIGKTGLETQMVAHIVNKYKIR